VTLLERVAAILSQREIRHALIGAAALAVYGVSRSTLDQDLLVHDPRVFDADLWLPLAAETSVDIRRGDSDDPLLGVVRITREANQVVDVVVGRPRWQQDIVARATRVGDLPLLVVQPADLILLKLYAGGSQDKWDIEQLLAIDLSDDIRVAVDERVALLPPRSRDLWASLRRQS
jgi:predicted nucleotidyltransferase